MAVSSVDQLAIEEEALVLGFHPDCDVAYRRQLMSMGVLPGARLRVMRVAPLGDPMELSLRGYRLTLRRAEAAQIEVSRT